VAAELEKPQIAGDGEALRALLHRGLGASVTLGAARIRAAIEEADARLRRDGDPAAVTAWLRERLRAELPALNTALDEALGTGTAAGWSMAR